MTIMVDTKRALTGGVDTHADVHVAAVIDPQGGLLGVESFRTDLAGCQKLSDWMCAFGEIGLVGVEGTGSYGAGLARHLRRVWIKAVGRGATTPERPQKRRATAAAGTTTATSRSLLPSRIPYWASRSSWR